MFDRLFSHPEQILYSLPAILIGLIMHELAHAFVASKLGDPTPRQMGRLTLNPLPHLDPIGTAMLVLVGFGWAKPVTTNPAMYRKCRKHGFALVGFAGPLMNLLLAFVFLFIFELLLVNGAIITDNFLYYIMFYLVWYNVLLFIFNLIPIPPLDGYNILKNLVLVKYVNSKALWTFERYGQFVLLGIVLLLSYMDTNILGSAVLFVFKQLENFLTLIFPFLR